MEGRKKQHITLNGMMIMDIYKIRSKWRKLQLFKCSSILFYQGIQLSKYERDRKINMNDCKMQNLILKNI